MGSEMCIRDRCKRTGLRSQFRAGVGPLLPLESERCPAFLRPGLMVRANALHYAMRIRTLHCTMERVCALREWQRHKLLAGLQEEQRRRWQARRYFRTIELVEEAGEGAEEIMNNISSAGAKRCAPAFATCALHS